MEAILYKDKLMWSQTFRIRLFSSKLYLSQTSLLQKVRFRIKVRENRTLWEHWLWSVVSCYSYRLGSCHLGTCRLGSCPPNHM